MRQSADSTLPRIRFELAKRRCRINATKYSKAAAVSFERSLRHGVVQSHSEAPARCSDVRLVDSPEGPLQSRSFLPEHGPRLRPDRRPLGSNGRERRPGLGTASRPAAGKFLGAEGWFAKRATCRPFIAPGFHRSTSVEVFRAPHRHLRRGICVD